MLFLIWHYLKCASSKCANDIFRHIFGVTCDDEIALQTSFVTWIANFAGNLKHDVLLPRSKMASWSHNFALWIKSPSAINLFRLYFETFVNNKMETLKETSYRVWQSLAIRSRSNILQETFCSV